MTEYIGVKKSQVHLFEAVPFYYRTGDGAFALYKKRGERLAKERIDKTRYPGLYIPLAQKAQATRELMAALKKELAENICRGGLVKVKETLGCIVEEALDPGGETAVRALPETIEVLLGAYGRDRSALTYLSRIAGRSSLMVEHTVNVTALTLQYCFFHGMDEETTQRLGLAALLHDVGCVKIDRGILESQKRLTQKQYSAYTAHPVLGHDMIIVDTHLDVAIPTVILEHHERMDGSGYPNGLKQISPDSQLIGLIDCYESLTYRNKSFRKARKPFDALRLIREEVVRGKFSKSLFRSFTSCLVG